MKVLSAVYIFHNASIFKKNTCLNSFSARRGHLPSFLVYPEGGHQYWEVRLHPIVKKVKNVFKKKFTVLEKEKRKKYLKSIFKNISWKTDQIGMTCRIHFKNVT